MGHLNILKSLIILYSCFVICSMILPQARVVLLLAISKPCFCNTNQKSVIEFIIFMSCDISYFVLNRKHCNNSRICKSIIKNTTVKYQEKF